ncbi:DUF2231 domain-containing protein [Thermomonas sp.]|uniref:DUF2231 domain-containing protein n=1 Tax=Thermomonas sp. TaxID=1971895 RepID=UPI0026097F95|nr:DUF2231 domain-containing protein [Thermomonas sp.]
MKHPLHPALVHFPIACWVLASLADFGGLGWHPEWLWPVSAGLAALGCILGLLAAGAGMLELTKLDGEHPAGRTAMWHMTLALTTWCLFAGSLVVRMRGVTPLPPDALVLALDGAGLVGVLATGWLGGTLVYVHGVGVGRREG